MNLTYPQAVANSKRMNEAEPTEEQKKAEANEYPKVSTERLNGVLMQKIEIDRVTTIYKKVEDVEHAENKPESSSG